MKKMHAILFLFWGILSINLNADIRGLNLLEYQYGNIPNVEPEDLSTIYDQFQLFYRQSDFNIKVQLEMFQNPDQDLEYQKLSQYLLRYKKDNLELKFGHLYDIIGRGLLFRAYEIPGNINEDIAFRVRHGFYRDLKGASVKYRARYWEMKALYGRSLNLAYPPTFDENLRRSDLVEGIEMKIHPGNFMAGTGLIRNHQNSTSSTYGSLFGSGTFFQNMSFYVEWAQGFDEENPLFKKDEDSRYALYSSVNWSKSNLGFSVEYKDYHQFLIGSGINDLPPLVREHHHLVLNRKTHITNYLDEQGFQVEGYYHFPKDVVLTLNYSEATNQFFREFQFYEYFAELNLPLNREQQLQLFLDWAQDEFLYEKNRLSSGLALQQLIHEAWFLNFHFEYQTFKNDLKSDSKIQNMAIQLDVNKGSEFSVMAILERSTDPFLTDNIKTLAIETKPRFWPGLHTNWQFSSRHRVDLFVGERQGGPACTSGICHEILDFKGVEFRLTTRI